MGSTTIPQPDELPDLQAWLEDEFVATQEALMRLEKRIDELVLNLNKVKTELRPK